ncbi:hypothetical protein E4O92_15455 [Massilia horti]|uniref:DNA mismatch repair proteins mutS family domain-containing protein n=2 Tax=Massilia horti TaxID=2562153 RepID=A0A4Y9SWQ3_9BURK|nr:hypothetical protein E4O92_15455 [Massilia horti]
MMSPCSRPVSGYASEDGAIVARCADGSLVWLNRDRISRNATRTYGSHPPLLFFAGQIIISIQHFIGRRLAQKGRMLVFRSFVAAAYAAQAALPALPVYTSMQGEDSLFDGESLYQAELRRAKELLDSARSAGAGVYLIDEVFRGTNHIESVAAGAAVLDELAERAMVLVSSHNLILAPLLAHRLQAYCIRRNGNVLELGPGVLSDTNGISLLATGGFDQQVEDKARRVARWLCAGIRQPGEAATVLAHGLRAPRITFAGSGEDNCG